MGLSSQTNCKWDTVTVITPAMRHQFVLWRIQNSSPSQNKLPYVQNNNYKGKYKQIMSCMVSLFMITTAWVRGCKKNNKDEGCETACSWVNTSVGTESTVTPHMQRLCAPLANYLLAMDQHSGYMGSYRTGKLLDNGRSTTHRPAYRFASLKIYMRIVCFSVFNIDIYKEEV